jgi:hypothetical protein
MAGYALGFGAAARDSRVRCAGQWTVEPVRDAVNEAPQWRHVGMVISLVD